MVVDPQNSVFLDYWQTRDASLRSPVGSKIEGIGRPRVEPSFIPDVVDEMLRVPDAASVATALWLETQLGRKVGASTGTNMWGVLQLAARMREEGRTGSIVTLLCDSGERYRKAITTRSGWRTISAILRLAGGDRRSGRKAIKSQIEAYLACWKSLYSGNKEDQDYPANELKMGDCLIPAVANYRQMRQLGFQLRHRVAHDEPRPTLPSISRSFIASPKAMHSCRVKPKCWLSTASAAPLLQPTGSTSRQSIAEKQRNARSPSVSFSWIRRRRKSS